MRRSVLSYRREDLGRGPGLCMVALHGGGATCAQLLPFCRSLTGVASVFAPEGPVPSEGRLGTLGPARDWFVEDERGAIEPSGFADSLHQVEQFIFDTIDDIRRPDVSQPGLYVLGLGQGGVMALTICAYWPELFKGIVSIEGRVPEIPGWDLPQSDLKQLRVLLVRDTQVGSAASGDAAKKSASRLASLGARVTMKDQAGASKLDESLGKQVSEWLAE